MKKKIDTVVSIFFACMHSLRQRMRDSICIFALRGKNKGVAAIELAASKAPPEPCIEMGSNPSPLQ